jgi:hypothetical protein
MHIRAPPMRTGVPTGSRPEATMRKRTLAGANIDTATKNIVTNCMHPDSIDPESRI